MTQATSRWVRLADELGPGFAKRAAEHDAHDSFVKESFDELKRHGVFAAAVPAELGGGGASYRELCDMLRHLAHYCSSTALALSMHTHLVATNAFRWKRDPAPFEKILERVAAEGLVLVSTGGSDWLPGSGRAEKVEGGYRITGRKVFGSGSPAGDLLMTCAIDDKAPNGPEVLHFAVPLKHESVRLRDTWYAHGMRGTGSHEIDIEGFFVADAAVGGRRPAGKWGPLFHAVYLVAFPLVYSVYVGVAEAARELAVAEVKKRGGDELSSLSLGELENELFATQLALERMVSQVETREAGPEATNVGLICRSLVGEGVVRTVEKAVECVGSAAFFRKHPLERLWRDVQAARFHALRRNQQLRFTGRYALGLDIDG